MEIEWKDEPQKYVVNCLLTPDEPVKLYAFKTSPILEGFFYVLKLDFAIFENRFIYWYL